MTPKPKEDEDSMPILSERSPNKNNSNNGNQNHQGNSKDHSNHRDNDNTVKDDVPNLIQLDGYVLTIIDIIIIFLCNFYINHILPFAK